MTTRRAYVLMVRYTRYNNITRYRKRKNIILSVFNSRCKSYKNIFRLPNGDLCSAIPRATEIITVVGITAFVRPISLPSDAGLDRRPGCEKHQTQIRRSEWFFFWIFDNCVSTHKRQRRSSLDTINIRTIGGLLSRTARISMLSAFFVGGGGEREYLNFWFPLISKHFFFAIFRAFSDNSTGF